MRPDSSVGITTDYGMDYRGLIPCTGKRFFSSPQRPDWLWTHTVSYPMDIEGFFPRG
jgi:hypothetical protein